MTNSLTFELVYVYDVTLTGFAGLIAWVARVSGDATLALATLVPVRT